MPKIVFIQVIYYICTSLSEYLESTSNKNWIFPDFRDKCPICGGKNCPVRIGFYYRWIFDFNEKKLLYIPIARYLCKRKNIHFKNKSADKTFSLLLSSIIPYHHYDINCLMHLSRNKHLNNMTLLDCSNELVLHFEPLDISFGVSTAVKYLKLFDSGRIKLSFFRRNPYFNNIIFVLRFFDKLYNNFFKYVSTFYNKYNRFIFGTPSQQR
jgi:hypothetical protein